MKYEAPSVLYLREIILNFEGKSAFKQNRFESKPLRLDTLAYGKIASGIAGLFRPRASEFLGNQELI
jgi:hypothetical protein